VINLRQAWRRFITLKPLPLGVAAPCLRLSASLTKEAKRLDDPPRQHVRLRVLVPQAPHPCCVHPPLDVKKPARQEHAWILALEVFSR